ncbi:alpha/beta hydrolase [Mycobacterium sp. Marseille-P9652]|uniref:alpha/beta hydrolase n=1 Tax=Mycobacterium sp. Marseille-P9652 TaxID=2654950 RepID=UPI0012E7CDB0|nr:hypothetical protein [Mycobacterium sp. Marseille-P9652]
MPDRRSNPLTQILGSFTRTGGFYARSWGTYLDRQPDELPVARPTIALAAQAFRDEILLTGFSLLRHAPDAATLDRIDREVQAAQAFYQDKGWLDSPEGFFTAPPPLTDVTVKPVSNMGRLYQRFTFDSLYAPHDGEPGGERWQSYSSNDRVYGLMFRHRRPRPWLICIHGAEMGRAALDPMLFNAWHLYRHLGLNVVLPVLPLHGPRSGPTRFPSEDVLDDVHGAAQSVWDVRRLITWIRAEQPDAKVGLNGISLGGLVSSLVASLDDTLTCAILGVPAVDLVKLVGRHAGLSGHIQLSHTMAAAKPIGRMVSPLALTPKVPPEGRFIYAGLADRLVHPRDQVTRLWEHWGKPEIHWYAGGHTGFFRSRPLQRFVDDALIQSGLVDAARTRR